MDEHIVMKPNSIVLIETSEELFEDYYAIRSDRTDVYWNGYLAPPDKDNFRKLYLSRLSSAPFEHPEDRRLYLVKLSGGGIIGFLQLIKREDTVEIGYSIKETFQGKGYGTRALALGIGLARVHSENIIVRIRDDNIASQRVAIKNGFERTDTYVFQSVQNMRKVKLRTYRLPGEP